MKKDKITGCSVLQGDFKDYLWMGISISVLVYFAATMYMLYEHMYYSSGMLTFAEYMQGQR